MINLEHTPDSGAHHRGAFTGVWSVVDCSAGPANDTIRVAVGLRLGDPTHAIIVVQM